MNKWLIILLISGITGCSNKVIYDNLRQEQRNQCVKEPPSSYSECLEYTQKSYQEYERERKELSGVQN